MLPPYWHHATLNIGDAVAVGGQHNAMPWQSPALAFEALSARRAAAKKAGEESNPKELEMLVMAPARRDVAVHGAARLLEDLSGAF